MKEVPFDSRVAHLLRYELRDLAGHAMRQGETAGKKSWIDHPTFGDRNAIKRVKSALGLRWTVKTTKAVGPGDIVRRFEDGSTLHIWIKRDAPVSEKIVLDDMAKHVSAGSMTSSDAVLHIRTAYQYMFDGISNDDIKEAIEDAAIMYGITRA